MSSAFRTVVSRRIERSSTTGWLALGDAVVITAFLAMGATHHGIDPLGQPLRVAETVAPFLVGWAIAAPLVGAYGSRARQSLGVAVAIAVAAWLPANILGAALRSTAFFPGQAPLTFVAVTFGVGAVSLAAWRAVFARFARVR